MAHSRKHKTVIKNIEAFHELTGINVCSEYVVTSAPPPRVLTRTGGARVATVEHKEMSKQIRNLEQKLHDSEQKRSELLASKAKHREKLKQTVAAMTLEHERQLSSSLKELTKHYEVQLKDLESNQEEVKQQLQIERAATERRQLQIQRHIKVTSDTKAKAASVSQQLKDTQTQVQQFSSLPSAHPPPVKKRTRKSLDPQDAARGRAKHVVEQYFQSQGWSEDETCWVLAKMANRLGVSGALLSSRTGRQRTTTESDRTLRSRAMEIKDLVEELGDDAFQKFLSDIPPPKMLEHLSDEQRRFVIRGWSDKVQEFWSVRRSAYLKSITLTSNKSWAWNRALLGRKVVNGRWVDQTFDGIILVVKILCIFIIFFFQMFPCLNCLPAGRWIETASQSFLWLVGRLRTMAWRSMSTWR